MATNSGRRALGLAAVLGVAAAVIGYYGLSGVAARASSGGSENFRDVVVTTADLTYGVKLERTMLRTARYPKDAVPVGAYATIDSVVGQVTKVFMGSREPVTATKLSSRGGGLSMLVRPTMRAVSIEVNAVSGVSGFVLPGDRVDVLVTAQRGGFSDNPITKTLLQNVEVLAAGQKTQQKDGSPLSVQSVTLLVNPVDAEKAAHAGHEGEIHLVLRNPDDNENVQVSAFTTGEMLGGGAPAPAAAPHRSSGGSSRPAPAPAYVPPAPAPANRQPGTVRIIRSAQVSEQPAVADSTGR